MTDGGALADPEITIELARGAAAAFLRASSPADAFDRLAPWVTTRGTRAQAILWELDEYLTAYSMGELQVLPDPRWETHCAALAQTGDEAMIRESANGIARGLAYYRLPRPSTPPPFSRLSLADGEQEDPRLVVGFEPPPDWTAPAVGSWMPTLYDVRDEAALVGFVLRVPSAVLAQASEPAASPDLLHGLPVIYFEPLCRPWEGPQHWRLPLPREVQHALFSSAHVDELRAAAALAGRSVLGMAVLSANAD